MYGVVYNAADGDLELSGISIISLMSALLFILRVLVLLLKKLEYQE